jgi:AraC-like DNA-binding protein
MDSDERISDKVILRLLQLLDKAYPGENVSFALAKVIPINFLGDTGRVLHKSADLGTLLILFAQYHDLLSEQMEVTLIDTDDYLLITTHHPFDKFDGGLGVELVFALCKKITNLYFDDDLLGFVQFQHSPRTSLTAYEAQFSVPVMFNHPHNAIAFKRSKLKTKNRKVRPEITSLLRQELNQLRQSLSNDTETPLDDIHNGILYNAEKGDYSVQGLSKTMNVSTRSLQRRLRDSGTCARELIDGYRYKQSLDLLKNKRLSIDEVAFRQGFDSERGFRKAFERWAKTTPSQARKHLEH